jgi:DUF438 domain-containing protein
VSWRDENGQEDLHPLLDRAHKGGDFTLNQIRDQFGPQVSQLRALELTIRIHKSVQDLSEPERVCALVCALMMELI